LDNKSANIIEVFSSAQGEGLFVGQRQIFVRMAGCNLDCKYCDTDFRPVQNARIEQTPGMSDFEYVSNPVEIDTLFYYLKKLMTTDNLHSSISLTGGEPLLQVEFLREFLIQNKAKYKYDIYLETNGTLYQELEQVIKLVNFIAMDIKLPSSSKDGKEYWQQHKKFLEVIANTCKCKLKCFIKVVIDNNFSDSDLHNIIWCMSSSGIRYPLVLQPESNNPPEGTKLLQIQQRFLKQLSDVRIIPQTHKIININ